MQAELSAFQNVLDRKGIFGNYQLSTAEKPLLMQKYAIDVSCLGKCVLALVIPWDGGSHSDFRHMAWHSVATTDPCMGHQHQDWCNCSPNHSCWLSVVLGSWLGGEESTLLLCWDLEIGWGQPSLTPLLDKCVAACARVWLMKDGELFHHCRVTEKSLISF